MSTLPGLGAPLIRDKGEAAMMSALSKGRGAVAQHVASLFSDPLLAARAKLEIAAAPDLRSAARAGADLLQQAYVNGAETLAEMKAKLARLERLNEGMKDLMEWAQGPCDLAAVLDSQFHLICAQNLVVQTIGEFTPPEFEEAQSKGVGVFLLQHDWAALLDGADVEAGGIRLPFDYSVFEMEIGTRRVCALVAANDGAPYRLIPIIRARGGWFIVCSYDVSGGQVVREGWPAPEEEDYTRELGVVIMAQVRAIAITLDAEVVRADVVRAPHLSNTAISRGVRQSYDHHILSLNRRYRTALASLPGAPGHHKRLHFRRGHWRHYPSHKTWIRWCLVGDPTLGFADKDYAL